MGTPGSHASLPPAVLMQFMGDQPKPRGKDEMELLYELLKVSEGCARWDLGRHPRSLSIQIIHRVY